jgi:hypothetical protein
MTFEFEYLGKFEFKFENILGCESEAHLGSIHGKKTEVKISCKCFFKCFSTVYNYAEVQNLLTV